MDVRERRELHNGFGNALARAFELALTPAVFAGFGWLLDRQLGTSPVGFIALFLFAVIGVGYMTWKRYGDDMARQEADAPWRRDRPVVPR